MKVVFAPDKFAGTLTAADAAAAMVEGWRRARSDDEAVVVPMADGGEGTVAAVSAAVATAEVHELEVADARGRPRQGRWLKLPDGRALVEVAEACGLSHLAVSDRNPLRATSFGVGQLLRDAVGKGASEIVVGLGGSATVDGGGGMLTALGWRLRRADGNCVKVGGGSLGETTRIEPGPDLGVGLVVATDVTNPLLGPHGAARVFGPQKGADDAAVEELERGLAAFAAVVERDLGTHARSTAGAGAAGGLGFAFIAALGARVEPGAAVIAGLVGLDRALAGAQVVVTGEGALDRQSAAGKVPVYVRDRAREAGARIFAVAGRVEDGATEGFDRVATLGPEGLERATELLTTRTEELARSVG